MPRRALRCIVDLELHAVSAPGVWLPSREDVYVSVSLFNQYRNTRLAVSSFPLILSEKFRFEKTYYTAVDPSQVADMLEDEIVIFELVQLSEYTDGAVRLASYSTNCRDFLYPYSTLAPSYSAHEREILMCRTVAFPGISPKLEFSTKTIIRESISPELDALDDALARKRVLRSSYRDPLPVYKTRFSTVEDDIDREVAALTMKRALSPISKPRPRSVSPLLYRKSLKERVDDIVLERSLSPTYYDRVLARERELTRLRRLNRIYDDYYTSVDDLDLELRLARIRASRY